MLDRLEQGDKVSEEVGVCELSESILLIAVENSLASMHSNGKLYVAVGGDMETSRAQELAMNAAISRNVVRPVGTWCVPRKWIMVDSVHA